MKVDVAELKKKEPRSGAGLMLWIGFILPPLAWAMEMEAMWLTTEWGCDKSEFKWNHVVAIIALLISIAGVLIAWTQSKATPDTPESTTIEKPGTRDFMSIVATVLGILFTMLIFAQYLPTLMGVPCSK
jgi:hypothetical protein